MRERVILIPAPPPASSVTVVPKAVNGWWYLLPDEEDEPPDDEAIEAVSLEISCCIATILASFSRRSRRSFSGGKSGGAPAVLR